MYYVLVFTLEKQTTPSWCLPVGCSQASIETQQCGCYCLWFAIWQEKRFQAWELDLVPCRSEGVGQGVSTWKGSRCSPNTGQESHGTNAQGVRCLEEKVGLLDQHGRPAIWSLCPGTNCQVSVWGWADINITWKKGLIFGVCQLSWDCVKCDAVHPD